jgi:hypothetical protein
LRRPIGWPLIIILSAGAIGFAVLPATAVPPFRALAAFWFLLICPGMAFVPLLRIGDCMTDVPLGIALSIALDAVVAEAMVLTRHWSPEWGLLILICISIAGAALQIITYQAHPRSMGAAK